MSTIAVPDDVPSAADDCEQLRKAFSGWGTNEDLIITILARRNGAQRKAIRQTYVDTYGEDLLVELDKELSSDFEVLVKLWALDPIERDAMLANEVTKESNATGPVLVEIACARSTNELLRIKKAYQDRYKKSLEEDVAHHTTGDTRKLLVPLLSTYRYEGTEVDEELAKSEAKMLDDKISDRSYSDEEIIRIFSTRSKAQINATLNKYKDDVGRYVNKDLKPDSSDKYLKLLRGTVRCMTKPEKYFEKLLRLAIERRGTDEGTLTRVIVTRAEVDMQLIKEVFQNKGNVALESAIAKDTGGDYETMLLALIGQVQA